MTKSIQYIFLTGILLCSCQNANKDNEITVTDFPIEKSLSGTRIDLTEGEYLSNEAYFAGDYLVFQSIRDNFFCRFMTENSISLIKYCIRVRNQMNYLMHYGKDSGPAL